LTRSVTQLSLAVILLSASCSTPFARVHYNRGKALFDDIAAADPGNWDFSKAIAEFNRAIHLKPDYVDAYHVRGLAYLITGNHTGAIDDLDEAIRLKTKIALSYMLRGMAYDHLGKKARAEADMDKARELGLQYRPEPQQPELSQDVWPSWDGDWAIQRRWHEAGSR
jgi:Flp pilus assembly protein TadD